MAEWLMTETMQKARDKYLKMNIVSYYIRIKHEIMNPPHWIEQMKNCTKPSYSSNHTLQNKIDALPVGPGWTCEMVHMGSSSEIQCFIYEDKQRETRVDGRLVVECTDKSCYICMWRRA